MAYITVDVDLDDILPEFDTDDLIAEIRSRQDSDAGIDFAVPYEVKILIRTIYENRRLGKDYQTELDNLIYVTLGNVL